MIRDLEIERLVKYAQALDTRIVFSNKKNPSDAAEFTIDGSQITIYTKKNSSKTDTVLTILHEVAHLLDHIHKNDRVMDDSFEEALPDDNEEDISKKRRKKILNVEKSSTKYWEIIYKETNLSFPIYKLHAQMEMDIWSYEIYHETGKFPILKKRNEKRKEIYAKHKKVKYE